MRYMNTLSRRALPLLMLVTIVIPRAAGVGCLETDTQCDADETEHRGRAVVGHAIGS